MDSTVEIQSINPSEARSDRLGEKRPAENGNDGELGSPATKKARVAEGLAGSMKKVAEIVLVLAAMGKMRGGRSPTPAEKDMMAEAREKLVELCEGFAPKDVFPRDAFGTVIEDLGLDKLREQRLGFRPPKISIAEKLLLTKQKMEKSEELSLRSTPNSSQRSRMNLGSGAESHVVQSPAVRMFPSDKPSHAPVSSPGLQPALALGHVSTANSTSLPYQLPTSEVRPMVSSGLTGSHLARNSSSLAMPRVERPQFKLDGRSNGSSYTSQVQANLSGDHSQVRTPTWSLQPQSTLTATSAKIGLDNKVQAHTSVKAESAANLSSSRMTPQVTTSKPIVTQTTSGNPPSIHQHLLGMNSVQTPSMSNHHSEISKIVQKLLLPQLPERPTWTPPSRDYMNKALICQMCKLTLSEVDSVLVCDACETGFHLKCLQSYNQKVIPRGEWHCQKCLTLSSGKPLPPKYGRVMRNISTPKVSSNSIAVESSLDKKVGNSDENVNLQKIATNGNSGLQSAPAGATASTPTGTAGNNCIHSASVLKAENAKELQGNDILLSGGKMDNKTFSGACSNNLMRTSGLTGVSPPTGSLAEGSCEPKCVADPQSQSPTKHKTVISSCNHPNDTGNPQDIGKMLQANNAEVLTEECHDKKLLCKDSDRSSAGSIDFKLKHEKKQDDQGTAQVNPVETSGSNIGHGERATSLSDSLHDVDWIGDIFQIVDEKTYYQSCCINGIVYKVHDYALLRCNAKLVPFKLQAMWEDSKTRSKWVNANQCYFPSDLPVGIGRPCSTDSNEVYESNHDNTVMAGVIQGPCEVLSPSKFIEESERRMCEGTGTNVRLRPLFLCKWFYDELKGLFRDVSI